MAFNDSNYVVSQFVEYDPTTTGTDILFMEPIDTTHPDTIAFPYNYYWVNSSNTTPIDATDCNFASAACTPVNDPGLAVILTWAAYDGMNNNVYYKDNAAYGYKHAPTAVTNVQQQGWQVYPNPAVNALMVNSTGAANAATGYQVLDMAGRGLLQGALQKDVTTIDVSLLTPGYLPAEGE